MSLTGCASLARARHGDGRARWRFLPVAAVTALVISGVSLPAAATSAVTVEAFADLCLERALSGKPVESAALARGMEITGETTLEESDPDTPKQKSITVEGIPLTIVTTTAFAAHQVQAPKPEGIVVLTLGMSKTTAKDPSGRHVDLVQCGVLSAEEPDAARALIEVQRELSEKLPREAVASAPNSRIQDGITNDHISWTWGDIDSDTGRFRVGYSGSAGPGFMGGGMLTAYRVVRAPE